VKKFCYLSSLTAVGPSPEGKPVDETAPCRPITSYGESKLEAERVCMEFSKDIPVVVIRPPAVYGPRDSDILDHLKDRIRAGKGSIRGEKADHLAYAIMDAVIDEYFITLEKVGDHIEDLDDEILASSGALEMR